MLIFFLSLFLLIFFEVKCVVDRYKWHRPFQMATTVLTNGNDRLRKGNLRRRRKAPLNEETLLRKHCFPKFLLRAQTRKHLLRKQNVSEQIGHFTVVCSAT